MLLQDAPGVSREIMSSGQACEFLGISKSSLYKLTSGRSINFFKPNRGRVYFLKSDLENWILASRQAPISDVENSCRNNESGRRI
jgi:excisionase family DNA binding protein